MPRFLRFATFVPLALLLTSGLALANQSSAVAELKAADAALQKAVEKRDLEGIVSFYSERAVLLPTAEPMVSGKAAIREEWKHILSIPDFANAASMTGVEVSSGGDMGYTIGTYRSVMAGEDGTQVTEPGKWVSIWKLQPDGAWRIVVDIYNTDIPPPDHK